MKALMLVSLLVASPVWAGSYTTTPEQDKTLAALAAEKGSTPQAALADILDRVGKARAQQQIRRDAQAIQQACAKGDQKACQAISHAAKDVKK